MVQTVNMQNVKVEVNDFEQARSILNDLIMDGFNVSATIQADSRWLIVADRERQPGQLTWSPQVSSGTFIGTGGINET